MRPTSWIGSLVHASAALFAVPALAQGSLPSVEIECPLLTREQKAEVEARARADLMTSGAAVLQADLGCSVDRVTVTLGSERSSSTHTAALYDENVREALIEALAAALQRLMHPEPEAPHPPAPAANPSSESENESQPSWLARPPAPSAVENAEGATPGASRPVGPRASSSDETPHSDWRSRHTADVGGGAVLEWWRGRTAVGASLEGGYGSHTVSVILQLGALTAVPSAQAFDALELSAAVGLRWQPEWSKARVSVSIGPSWLDVAARGSYEPRGATDVWAGFALLELSRPLWFGAWSLTPKASARFFVAERRVNLDGRPMLRIGHFAPHLAVSLARSFE